MSIARGEEIKDVLGANIKDDIVQPENLVKSSFPLLPCCKLNGPLYNRNIDVVFPKVTHKVENCRNPVFTYQLSRVA